MKKILIINYQGIGNTVLMMPLLLAIKSSNRFKQVDMTVKSKVISNLLNGEDVVDSFIYYGRNNNIVNRFDLILERLRLILRIRKTKYDIVVNIDQTQSLTSIFFMILIRGRKKIGVNLNSDNFNPYDTILTYSADQPEKFLYEKIAETIGITDVTTSFPIFKICEYEIKNSLKYLPEEFNSMIAIHPGCGEQLKYKRWEKEKFTELIRALIMIDEVHVLVLGGKEEESLANDILDNVESSKYTNLVGKLNIRETTAVLSKCSLIVSNDSGIMHLGGAMNIPVVAIFGPTSQAKNSPLGGKHILIGSNDYCDINSNKLCDLCRQSWNDNHSIPLCLEHISVDDVLSGAYKTMK